MERKVSGPQAVTAENRGGADHEKEASLGEVTRAYIEDIFAQHSDAIQRRDLHRVCCDTSVEFESPESGYVCQQQVFIELSGGTMLTESLNTKLRKTLVLFLKRLIQELAKQLQKNGTSSTKKMEKCTISYGEKDRLLKLPKHLIHGYLQLAKV